MQIDKLYKVDPSGKRESETAFKNRINNSVARSLSEIENSCQQIDQIGARELVLKK